MQVPAVGEVFEGRFEILGEIGRGAFGVVLRARDRRNGEIVAIKCLEPEPSGYPQKVAARFAEEARALSLLNHPNIVRHIEHGQTASGLLYLVMECLEGGDLRARLAGRERLEPTVVADVVAQVLSALKETHRHGLVHRDIKPSNILFAGESQQNAVKLVDFGIAKLAEPIDGRPGLTGTGMVIGTPKYMAPELTVGEPANARSDLYALGIVGMEMLAGAAFSGERHRSNVRKFLGSSATIKPLSGAGIVAQVIERMAQGRPTDRYQNANEPLSLLIPKTEQILVVTTLESDRSESTEAPKPAARNIIGLALLLALSAVAVSIATAALLSEPPQPLEESRTSPVVPPLSILEIEPTPSKPDLADQAETSSLANLGPFASPGCGSPAPFRGAGTISTGVLTQQQWPVLLPDDYDPEQSYPLLIVFHPDLFSGPVTVEHLGHEALMKPVPQIVLSPDFPGFRRKRLEAYDDVIEGIHAVAESLCVDSRRIRALGFGNGVQGAERLARHGWLTAVVTGGYVPPASDAAVALEALDGSQRPVPHLHLATVESQVYRTEGGDSCAFLYRPQASTSDYEEHWRTQNRCGDGADVVYRFGTESCYEWTCEQRFVSCHVDGGLHWPGSGRTEWLVEGVHGCKNDPTISEFPGTQFAMEFFANASPTPPEIPGPW